MYLWDAYFYFLHWSPNTHLWCNLLLFLSNILKDCCFKNYIFCFGGTHMWIPGFWYWSQNWKDGIGEFWNLMKYNEFLLLLQWKDVALWAFRPKPSYWCALIRMTAQSYVISSGSQKYCNDDWLYIKVYQDWRNGQCWWKCMVCFLDFIAVAWDILL